MNFRLLWRVLAEKRFSRVEMATMIFLSAALYRDEWLLGLLIFAVGVVVSVLVTAAAGRSAWDRRQG